MIKLFKIYVQFDYIKDEYVDKFAKSKWFKKIPQLQENLLIKLDKKIINVIVSDIDKQRKIIYVKKQRLKNDDFDAFQREQEKTLQNAITRIRTLETNVNKLMYQQKQNNKSQNKKIDIVKANVNNNALEILEQLNNELN